LKGRTVPQGRLEFADTFSGVTTLMLCIRARLQSGRKRSGEDEGFSL
jgi:hypothetical protein